MHDFKVAALWAFWACLPISSHGHSLIAQQNHNHQNWLLPSPARDALFPPSPLFRRWVSRSLPTLTRFLYLPPHLPVPLLLIYTPPIAGGMLSSEETPHKNDGDTLDPPRPLQRLGATLSLAFFPLVPTSPLSRAAISFFPGPDLSLRQWSPEGKHPSVSRSLSVSSLVLPPRWSTARSPHSVPSPFTRSFSFRVPPSVVPRG